MTSKKLLNTNKISSAVDRLHAPLGTNSFVSTSVASSGGLTRSALLEMIVREAPDGIVVCDAQGKVMLANAAAKRLAQLDPEGQSLKFPRRIWGEMFDVDGRIPAEEWPWMKALGGETIAGKECRFVRSDSSTCDILFSAVPVRIQSGQIVGIVATLVEITGLKRAELMLREQAVRRERGRMAADIHDTLSQGLSAVVLQLQAAEDTFPVSVENVQRRLRRARDVARGSLAQVRRFTWMLSDDSLDNEELASSLLSLAQRIFAATRVELKYSVHGEVHVLLPDARLELLRIAREALVNVLKHAQATTVYIRLTYEREWLQVRVEDDGQGFVPTFPVLSGSFGLIGMRKRAECLGGKVIVTSQPGLGTRIAVRIPLSLGAVRAVAA
jgi:signal transduction histidine kinase